MIDPKDIVVNWSKPIENKFSKINSIKSCLTCKHYRETSCFDDGYITCWSCLEKSRYEKDIYSINLLNDILNILFN